MKERDHFKEADIDGENNIKMDLKEIGSQRVN
jgi:hypothetical protein